MILQEVTPLVGRELVPTVGDPSDLVALGGHVDLALDGESARPRAAAGREFDQEQARLHLGAQHRVVAVARVRLVGVGVAAGSNAGHWSDLRWEARTIPASSDIYGAGFGSAFSSSALNLAAKSAEVERIRSNAAIALRTPSLALSISVAILLTIVSMSIPTW